MSTVSHPWCRGVPHRPWDAAYRAAVEHHASVGGVIQVRGGGDWERPRQKFTVFNWSIHEYRPAEPLRTVHFPSGIEVNPEAGWRLRLDTEIADGDAGDGRWCPSTEEWYGFQGRPCVGNSGRIYRTRIRDEDFQTVDHGPQKQPATLRQIQAQVKRVGRDLESLDNSKPLASVNSPQSKLPAESVFSVRQAKRDWFGHPRHGLWYVVMRGNDTRYLHADGVIRMGCSAGKDGAVGGWFDSPNDAAAAMVKWASQNGGDEHRKRVTTFSHQRGDLVTQDDGYAVFWPLTLGGSLTANDLRILADELDRINEPWDRQVTADFDVR